MTHATNPLVGEQCRQLKQHVIIYAGLGLCCLTDYSRDKKQPPRSYTRPVAVVASLGAVA